MFVHSQHCSACFKIAFRFPSEQTKTFPVGKWRFPRSKV